MVQVTGFQPRNESHTRTDMFDFDLKVVGKMSNNSAAVEIQAQVSYYIKAEIIN